MSRASRPARRERPPHLCWDAKTWTRARTGEDERQMSMGGEGGGGCEQMEGWQNGASVR